MQILKILQRKRQGFCPSEVRQNLAIAPIDLNSFLGAKAPLQLAHVGLLVCQQFRNIEYKKFQNS